MAISSWEKSNWSLNHPDGLRACCIEMEKLESVGSWHWIYCVNIHITALGRFLMHWAEEKPNAGSGHGTSPSSTLLLLFQHQIGSFICSLEDKNRQQEEKLFAKQRICFIPHLKSWKPVEKEQTVWPVKHLEKWWKMMLRGLRNLSCEQRLGVSRLKKAPGKP